MDWTALMRMHGGYEASRILQAAVEHDLFTHIAAMETDAGQRPSAVAIADLAATDRRATTLLLNALVTMGLLTKTAPADAERPFEGGTFHTTPVVRDHLVDGCAHDFRAFIRFDAANWHHWGELPDVLKDGGPAMQDTMFQGDADGVRRFIDAMESIGRARGDAAVVAERVAVPTNPRAGRRTHILDVGGGAATYAFAFLRKHPDALATVIDLPGTLDVTKSFLASVEPEVGRRVRLVACDYNADPIPPPADPGDPAWHDPPHNGDDADEPAAQDGYDLVWVSNIIHGEGPTNNARLAERSHEVLRPGGIVAIKEHIMDATLTRPDVGGIFGVSMLLFTEQGRVYGFDEVRRWYEDAGFFDVIEAPPTAPLTSSIVTARKAE